MLYMYRINCCTIVPHIGVNALIDLQFLNTVNNLYVRLSMRQSQSKFQYGLKNQASEIDGNFEYY